MARTITLKYDGECRDCGATLLAGARARYYGRGRVYGTECHEQKPQRQTAAQRSRAALHTSTRSFIDHNNVQAISAADPTGFYNASSGQSRWRYSAGECIGRQNAAGRCEDAPCCGCCS